MDRLYDKVYGCIAACHVGSAMGGPVEGQTHDFIKRTYGWLDKMLPYIYEDEGGPYRNEDGSPFMPGTTEDGIERQKLMILAIMDKKGRITARDLAMTWLKYVNEDSFGVLAGQQDEIHYRLIKAGIPPEDSGYYDAHIGRMGFNRACHPIGIINACFPYNAAHDAFDVGRLYQPPSGRGIPWKKNKGVVPAYTIGLDWAAAIAAAIAEAFKPNATPDSVVKEATSYIVEAARDEILRAVEIADKCHEYEELVQEFNKIYYAVGLPMAISRGYEITSKAIALFYFYKGDVKETILGAVNFGRDTDCLAAVSAGIAGAYSGSSGIPKEWIRQVNEATKVNKYTVTRMTIEELSQGLYDALMENYKTMRSNIDDMEKLMQ